MNILVVGSIAIDTIRTPQGLQADILGGSCTYFSFAASFFTHVDMVATVGRDFPESHLQTLRDKGIGLDGLVVADGKTFRWEGAYEGDMSQARTLATELNVFESFHPVIPEALRRPDILFLANIDPDLQAKVLDQVARRPRFVCCDTMNLWIENKKASLLNLLKRVDAVILNDAEARHLLGHPWPLVRCAREIAALGPRVVIIKKGEHGALLFDDRGFFFAPPYPVEKLVDPTGAGDTFAGGFLGALARSRRITAKRLRTCMVYGSCMASFTVENYSLERLKTLDENQIESRLNDFRKFTAF